MLENAGLYQFADTLKRKKIEKKLKMHAKTYCNFRLHGL